MIKCIELSIYDYKVYIAAEEDCYEGLQLLLETYKPLKKSFNSHELMELESALEECQGMTLIDRESRCITVLTGKNTGLNTLIHELYHATVFLVDHLELMNTNINNEAGAYIIDYLISQINVKELYG